MRREGLRIALIDLIAEAAFAGKSRISYGGATPCNAGFGRQPRILPDMLALPGGAARVAHYCRRLLEVALQRIA